MGLGQLKVQKGEFCYTAFPVHLQTNTDLHFSRNFYKLLEMPTHLSPSSSLLTVVDSGLRTHLSPDSISRRLVSSAVRCQLALCVSVRQLPSLGSFFQLLNGVPFPTAFSDVPLPTALASLGSAFFLPLPVSSEISILSPLFGFAPRQTKGSSAQRTTHIVSQFVFMLSGMLLAAVISLSLLFLISSSSPRMDASWQFSMLARPLLPSFLD